ncbi:uncharacterized protein L3040_006643 [Drepanopeziza brunnea f. sp. 'multigermtubi']|uniref:Uncharacterized protein n=1 Tax=Marssonina brunnea f. sp. multigermtubi (strain MB_m1) TaxID=1072389 RepID=K1XXJ8_MARBU|nr:uncharacterized protein MBM_04390 [Drepanopeziza brunnea f. sp. 'multigermtubi' MB_m1]EKD17529.1 hypothetical protein MBM_04390 [Drepanopeziza brunnea f. sp. 'multigermtubi' MB_m1]KAJ5038970.1 hypothetical protein L3040_006643 [Drepanopeziza brunnea f. sp. 'multigermtubi']
MEELKWKKQLGLAEKSYSTYEPITDSGTQSKTAVPEKRRRCRSFILGALLLISLVVIVPTVGTLWFKRRDTLVWPKDFTRLDPQAPPRAALHCGDSLEEAKARGCIFDIVTANYIHRDCPLDFQDEFYYYQNGTPWTYWKDQRGTMPMTLEELADADEYYSTDREHTIHCAFILKRQHAVMARGDRLDSMTGGFAHADHCVQYLLEGLRKSDEQLDRITTHSVVRWLDC